jgi:hypothetical protein
MSPDNAALFRPDPVDVCAAVAQMPLIVIMAQSWPVLAVIGFVVVLLGFAYVHAAYPRITKPLADEDQRPHEILEIRARRAGL